MTYRCKGGMKLKSNFSAEPEFSIGCKQDDDGEDPEYEGVPQTDEEWPKCVDSK